MDSGTARVRDAFQQEWAAVAGSPKLMAFYFGTNLKMHGTASETRALVQALEQGLESTRKTREVQCFILPPFTSLQGLAPYTNKLWLGAQTMHWADEGAYTGEVSPVMLKALGVELVMLGHAERRHKFGETNEMIRKKVQSALRHKFRVLLCVGETETQKRQGTGADIIAAQLETALLGVPDPRRLLIAYEPVWAIGEESREARTDEVQESLQTVRNTLRLLFKTQGGGQDVPVLYGGSVNEGNCATYALLELDGLFVGRAAWQPEGFLRVLARSLEAHVDQATTEGGTQ